jgi:hypothetical protein
MAGIIFSLRHDRIRSDGARQLTVHVTSFPFPFPYYIYIYIIYRQAIFVNNIIIYAKLPLLRNLQHRLPTSSRRTIPTAHLLIKFFLIQIKYPTYPCSLPSISKTLLLLPQKYPGPRHVPTLPPPPNLPISNTPDPSSPTYQTNSPARHRSDHTARPNTQRRTKPQPQT